MIDAVHVDDLFVAGLAGGLVVLAGALYALLYALGKLRDRGLYLALAYAAYGLLTASTLALARVLHLQGFWTIVVVVMLLGYFLAPRAIWHLCVGTHANPAVPNGDRHQPINRRAP